MIPVASANKKLFLNFSHYVFTKTEVMDLQKQLNFSVDVTYLSLDMVCAVEFMASKLPPAVGIEFKWKMTSVLENSKLLTSHIMRTESNDLKS
jgi:hypothetical protein